MSDFTEEETRLLRARAADLAQAAVRLKRAAQAGDRAAAQEAAEDAHDHAGRALDVIEYPKETP